MNEKKRLVLSLIASAVEAIEEPSRIEIDALVERHGGKLDFRAGAYVVQMAGVTGTSTMDNVHALESWLRSACKKLERVR